MMIRNSIAKQKNVCIGNGTTGTAMVRKIGLRIELFNRVKYIQFNPSSH